MRTSPRQTGATATADSDATVVVSLGDAARQHGTVPEREALMRLAAAAADAYRLEDVMEQAAEVALDVTGAASLTIGRFEREQGVLRTLVNVGELAPHEQRMPADEAYLVSEYPQVARLLREGLPYRTTADDSAGDPAQLRLLARLGRDSEIAVPILLDGDVWGEVWAATAPGSRRFGDDDMRFLQAIADRLALVLGRVERFSRVSRLAYEDPLTGLANRRAIEERLERLLDSDLRPRPPLTLLLADVDGLKGLNDARGHDAGDRALCRVGEALVAAAAPETAALVGRLSGDEFCVLLEGCELAVASAVAAAALELLADSRELPLSLSFGAAQARPDTGPVELLRAADTAQYASKQRGGGRLCTADPAAVAAQDGERRRVRPRGIDMRVEHATSTALRALDGELAQAPALDRIEAVAVGLADALNAAAWAISFWQRGSAQVRSVSTADDRDSRLRGLRMGLQNDVYELADFPATARALEAGHGGFLARADDESSDVAERLLLERLGFRAALAATAEAVSGAYLVELYADERSADPAPAATRLQLLARLAAQAPGAS